MSVTSTLRVLVYLAAALPFTGAGAFQRAGHTSDYRRLVTDYRRHDPSALSTVLVFTAGAVRSSAAAALENSSTWAADDLRAAAMLHTDACAELLRTDQRDAASVHLNAAVLLVNEAAVRDEQSRRFASLWYPSVTAMLSALGAPVWASQLAERSRPVLAFPSAEASFQKGLALEIMACGTKDRDVVDAFGMGGSQWLQSASARFADAVREDRSFHAAALHLGRIRLLQGSLGDAQRNLEIGARSALPTERYLALLFLGAIAERRQAFDEAEARYRAALLEFKWGQSGPLALARLLSRTNRQREADEVVSTLLERGDATVDPLWTYLAKPAQEPMAFLRVLRADTWQ
jgi:hypothetical protein